MGGKKSTERHQADRKLARDLAVKNDGAEYSDDMNPYIGQDEFRAERLKRFYEKEAKKHRDISARWNDLCEVYGFPTPEEMG